MTGGRAVRQAIGARGWGWGRGERAVWRVISAALSLTGPVVVGWLYCGAMGGVGGAIDGQRV